MTHCNIRAPYPEILDDLPAIALKDKRGMLTLTEEFPAQCREAIAITRRFMASLKPQRTPRNIVVSGLGGSAIGGDLVRCLVEAEGHVPLVVNRDYGLPAFVGADTLVIASSYSGNTEETLASYREARARGAEVVCVTSGGELARLAEADDVPVCRIPTGRPPRASTGYLFIPMAGVAAAYGQLDTDGLLGALEGSLVVLDSLASRCRRDSRVSQNPAKQLALELHGRIPLFYGTQGYRGVVAVRWKGQFNENAKVHAFANVLPEQNHNEILGWDQALQQSWTWSVVYLRDPNEITETPRIAKRVETLKTVIGNGAQQLEVWAEGNTLMDRMLSLVYLGDFVSVYAALLAGVDPTDIKGINLLKEVLSGFAG